MSNITDGMHDLSEWFRANQSYTDFEGMADAKAMIAICKGPDGKYIWDRDWTYDQPGTRELTRSLFLNWLYQRADTYGIEDLTYDKLIDPWECLYTIITGSKYWSKVTDEMIKDIETSTDEE